MHNKFLSRLILLIFTIGWGTTVAQQKYIQTIRGTVLDAKTEMPLPGATVILLNTEPVIGTSTDAEGRFRIENIPLGRQSIKVSYMGYAPAFVNNLMLASGKELVLEIKLEELVYQVAEVVIKANTEKDKPLNEMATVSTRSFSVEETERYAGSLGDPARMAANFAGVSSPSDQRNDIIIRGNSPMGLLWRMEGVEIPSPNHFGSMGSTGGPISMLNNNVLTNSDFYTGAFPAEYGNALAGAFDLKLRNGNNEKHEFLGQVGFNGFEVGAEGPFSKNSRASYLFNFRYSTLEVMKALKINFGAGDAVPQYKDLCFKINIPTKKLGRFTFFGVGGISFIDLLSSDSSSYGYNDADIHYGSDMGVAGISHTFYFKNDAHLSSTIAASGTENSIKLNWPSYHLSIPNYIERNREYKYTYSTKYNKKFSAKNNINIGFTANWYKVDYSEKLYDTIAGRYFYFLKNNGTLKHGELYGEWQHKFTDRLILNSGVFSQYLLLNNTYAVEPRVGIKKYLKNKQTFSFAIGMHSQMQPKFIYFTSSLTDTLKNTYTNTNTDIDFTRALHVVAGYDYLIKDGVRLKVETYYQYLYNIPVAQERPEYAIINQGADFLFQSYPYMLNKGKGDNYGIELTLEKFLNKGFYYLFTASVFNSTYEGNDGIKRPTAYDNNYVFNALTGYEIILNKRNILAFDIKGVWAGGRRYLPFNIEASKLLNESVYDWSQIYEKRFNDYFRINARITFKLNGRKINQEWGFDLQNLTNHKNIFTQTWNGSENKLDTDYQQGFMPMLTYRILF